MPTDEESLNGEVVEVVGTLLISKAFWKRLEGGSLVGDNGSQAPTSNDILVVWFTPRTTWLSPLEQALLSGSTSNNWPVLAATHHDHP